MTDIQGEIPTSEPRSDAPPNPVGHISTDVITAFVVFLTPDGRWAADSHLVEIAERVTLQRESDLGDFTSGCSIVAYEAGLQRAVVPLGAAISQLPAVTAQTILQNQMAMMQQAKTAAENERLAQKIFRPGSGKLI